MTAPSDPGPHPGGGRNPRPFAPGGGFSGMVGAQFRKYWIARPEIAPLLGALGIGVMLMAWGLVHEFGTNPRYTIIKGKRESYERSVAPNEKEADKFYARPFMPHLTKSFSWFGGLCNFKSIKDMSRTEGTR
mmetsp:Transcript_7802/g.20060  ORF Transcript_7802/g.20060 Transcript_7802/m.20060 type:complete len:132 (-) Transcript_7802:178-573(-)